MIFLLIFLLAFSFHNKPTIVFAESAATGKKMPFSVGEKIIYGVKMGPVRMGTSTLSYLGKIRLLDKEAEVIVFETTGLNFLDREKIYAETGTFYPLRVERTLNLWGRKLDIVEQYNSNDNSWRLVKREGGKITQESFKSNSRVQNIISVVYFYRQLEDLKVGTTLRFNFSNALVNMQVKRMVNFNAAGKRYKAFLLESTPGKYRVWLDSGEKRLPLRIDGSLIGFSNMAMIMREFK